MNYFSGAGALLSQRIEAAKVIAYDKLSPEAIRELTAKDLPLLLINDAHGSELYARPSSSAAVNDPTTACLESL